MSIHLPPPVALYLKGENSGELDSLDECFAASAIVRDEGRTWRGLPAIREWRAETRRRYHHRVTPLEVAVQGGATVMSARLDGNFPGSPVTVRFRFVLEDSKIASLEIGA
jgi:hypothetical protein